MGFAPNFTCRYKAHYVAAGINHSMTIRLPRGTSVADINTNGPLACNAVAQNMDDLLPEDFAWISAEYSLEDEEVFHPDGVLPGGVAGGVEVVNLSAVERITSTSFAGRGSAGRTAIRIWCPDYPEDDLGAIGSRGIILATEEAHIAAVVAALQAMGGALATNGNTVPTWYGRATVKRNDHLLRLVRRGLIG